VQFEDIGRKEGTLRVAQATIQVNDNTHRHIPDTLGWCCLSAGGSLHIQQTEPTAFPQDRLAVPRRGFDFFL
jgi:hypothetical protein